jgi:hypothetical protein
LTYHEGRRQPLNTSTRSRKKVTIPQDAGYYLVHQFAIHVAASTHALTHITLRGSGAKRSNSNVHNCPRGDGFLVTQLSLAQSGRQGGGKRACPTSTRYCACGFFIPLQYSTRVVAAGFSPEPFSVKGDARWVQGVRLMVRGAAGSQNMCSIRPLRAQARGDWRVFLTAHRFQSAAVNLLFCGLEGPCTRRQFSIFSNSVGTEANMIRAHDSRSECRARRADGEQAQCTWLAPGQGSCGSSRSRPRLATRTHRSPAAFGASRLRNTPFRPAMDSWLEFVFANGRGRHNGGGTSAVEAGRPHRGLPRLSRSLGSLEPRRVRAHDQVRLRDAIART